MYCFKIFLIFQTLIHSGEDNEEILCFLGDALGILLCGKSEHDVIPHLYLTDWNSRIIYFLVSLNSTNLQVRTMIKGKKEKR